MISYLRARALFYATVPDAGATCEPRCMLVNVYQGPN